MTTNLTNLHIATLIETITSAKYEGIAYAIIADGGDFIPVMARRAADCLDNSSKLDLHGEAFCDSLEAARELVAQWI